MGRVKRTGVKDRNDDGFWCLLFHKKNVPYLISSHFHTDSSASLTLAPSATVVSPPHYKKTSAV